jgi:hypothetical protein
MSADNLQLHIEQLVLHGFGTDRHRIAAALQQELTRLLTEQGIPPALANSSEIPHINISANQIPAGAKAETIGTQLAQSIYSKLNQ